MRLSTLARLLAALVLAGGLGCVVPVPFPPPPFLPPGGPPGHVRHPHRMPPGHAKRYYRETPDRLALEHGDPGILVVVSPRLGFRCWPHGDHYHCMR